jgi:rod shape-determining protein MreC
VPPYAPEPEVGGGRRQIALAGVFVAIALTLLYLPDVAQERTGWVLRASVLRPFTAAQERLVHARGRAREVGRLQAEMDSLTASLSTQEALRDENRTLRSLLDLRGRVGPSFLPASVLRPGTVGSESLFFIDRGTEDGVHEGAPVVDRHGLVGVIREARPGMSVGMDWTHPDFRASAMLADGTGFGMVENRRGDFREADRLVLNGTAYYESVPRGVAVLTSGLGGVFPRGIPIGKVAGVAEVEGRWRKSYWLLPMVEPASVTHVLVAVGETEADLSSAWPPDSLLTRREAILRQRSLADSLATITDSVRVLRARVERLQHGDTVRGSGG